MEFYSNPDPRDLYTQKELLNAFEIFREEIYPEDESIMCQIHDVFNTDNKKLHNCLGCNLADYTQLLHTALQIGVYSHPFEAFLNTTLYCYLLIERQEEIFKIIKLPESYRLKHFQIFGAIKRWSNFFKHPKAFILVHHPKYYFEEEVTLTEADKKINVIIDQQFIDTYYCGDQENNNLYKLLNNKKNVYVIMPNLPDLMQRFCQSQKKFLDIISNNEVFKEILDERSTLEDYFENNKL
jgi:hypothetical protein